MLKSFAAVLSLYVASVGAQVPPTPQPGARVTPPPTTAHSTGPDQRHPAPSRDQFFSPVMGINIEAQGLTLPKGVAEDPPITKPAAEPAAAPAAEPATPK